MNRTLQLTLIFALVVGTGYLAQASSPDGPGKQTTSIEPRSVDTFRITHIGGLPAQLRFKSYGETFLEVVVLNELGRVVATGNDSQDNSVLLTWLPAYTQTFTIRVINRAPVSNVYFISTN